MNIGALENKFLFKKSLCFLFSGKAGSGKTYCSNILKEECARLNYKSDIFSFATGVKRVARFMTWDGNKDIRGRRLLQKIGQVGREYDPDMWVRSEFTRIEETVGYPYDVVIFDDWRFPNEVRYIFDNLLLYKPVTVRVVAPERESLKGKPEYREISETSLDDFPFEFVIDNSVDGADHPRGQIVKLFYEEIEKNL